MRKLSLFLILFIIPLGAGLTVLSVELDRLIDNYISYLLNNLISGSEVLDPAEQFEYCCRVGSYLNPIWILQ